MKPPSKKRQLVLAADKPVVEKLYTAACDRFGKEAVDKDTTRLWDLRCIWGMQGVLPFDSGTEFKSLGEMLWIADVLVGLPSNRIYT